MRELLLIGLAATAILPACGVTEEEKAAKLSSAWCSRYQECRTEGFNKNWATKGQCENKETDRWTGKLTTIDGETSLTCTFDEKQIEVCSEALAAMDCADFSDKAWEEDCGAVLVCSQGLSADW